MGRRGRQYRWTAFQVVDKPADHAHRVIHRFTVDIDATTTSGSEARVAISPATDPTSEVYAEALGELAGDCLPCG